MNESVPTKLNLPRSLSSLTDAVDILEYFVTVVGFSKHLADDKSRRAMSVFVTKCDDF